MRRIRVLAIVGLVASLAPAHAQPPRLASPHAIALDAITGDELFAHDADAPRPIASMTKLFVAMVLRKARLDLDAWTEIAPADAHAAEGGAPTRLSVGQQFANRDLLAAMLMVSDNRVPTALARSAGIAPRDLLARTQRLARDLGLAHTTFADTTGIAGNESTAREMALALREALRDPLLRSLLSTKYRRVVSRSGEVVADYKSTVQPLWDKTYPVRGGKTGWTEDAGYCLIVAAEIGERPVVMAFLGARDKSARLADYRALAAWLGSRLPRVATSSAPAPTPRASASR